MTPTAVLITCLSVDFNTLIGLSHQALGYSISASSDSKPQDQNDAERFLSCLAAMRDPQAPAGLSPNLLSHASFSMLLASDSLDTISILECAAGMPFVTAETISDGIDLTVVTGTLSQWRDAVVSGTRRGGNIQAVYCQIMGLFEAQNLNVWPDFSKRWSGTLFLLEDKRK